MTRIVARLVVLAVASVLASQPLARFPHQRHARLFPSCSGCHSGVTTGVPDDVFPSPDRCLTCHDGERQQRVDWTGPTPTPSNLTFEHTAHARRAAAADVDVTCASCHQEEGAAEAMAVVRPQPERCLACHRSEAAHLDPAQNCRTCHAPLAETELPVERVASLPRPPAHFSSDFLESHGRTAADPSVYCATCHAQQSCARCHMNAATLPAIQALPRDDRIASLVAGRAAEYFHPASHDDRSWAWLHGPNAMDDVTSCADCHARSSCQTCHKAGDVPVFQGLPTPAQEPRGVTVTPGRVHEPGFRTAHDVAAARDETCASCHEQDFCSSCHQGASTPEFHGPDFMERHGADLYRASSDCASCHTTETFCRDCHASEGMQSGGQVGGGFHTAQPFWLLGHGQAARQALESCASCHAQSDCARCHSASGGWGINPHGADFDADRMRSANPVLCRSCHPSGTPGGGP